MAYLILQSQNQKHQLTINEINSSEIRAHGEGLEVILRPELGHIYIEIINTIQITENSDAG
nr:MAG TPA_asm: hypothetical protein [Caudoviricetes sp.]